ncbi:MAG: bifunctional 3-deoxy-7-phosphoheptulonate synthase/chorismate mutase type II [Bacteroidales bacterium]|nr:bifunctional 3-deoxy-7-phosphoheptulonate synthase/chorismate mutase type II [Bacteroidales bacterium]
MAKTLDTVPVWDWGFFTEPKPCVIAGPCSAETEEQVMATAKGLVEQGIHMFRAGIWKPRTHPGCFEGVGAPALKWMQKAKQEYGLKICTEVASEKHVYECLKYGVDLVWLGARTTGNPFLVQEIADALRDTDIPVLVKNPMNPDLDLWIGALERLNGAGIKKLGAIQRGFTSYEKIRYRNNPQWQVAVELRSRYPELSIFTDPSHLAGKRDYIQELSQRSLDLGFEGLMIESHCNPVCALSDAGQQLTPEALGELLASLVVRTPEPALANKETIDQLRAQIDVIDENLLHTLGQRMKVSRQIGQYKKENNVAIVQASRWDSLLANMVEKSKAYNLPEEFVRDVFNAIHEASVQVQNEILSGEQPEQK